MGISTCYLCGQVKQSQYVKKYPTTLGEIYICNNCKKVIDEAEKNQPLTRRKRYGKKL